MKSVNLLVLCCFLCSFSLMAIDNKKAHLYATLATESETFDQYFAKVAIPKLFGGIQKLLTKLIEIDASSQKDAADKTNYLNSATLTLISHFQNLMLEANPTHPPTKTQYLRIMIALWNSGQYELLPELLHEFDNSDSIKIKRKPMNNEKDLFNFIKRIFFQCGLIIGDVIIVLKPSTNDKMVMKEAIVSFLMQEAKDLSLATNEQLDKYKKVLEVQTEYNKEELWSRIFNIKHSIEYMLLRRPDNDHKDLFDQVLQRIVKENPKQHKSMIIKDIDQDQYQVVSCTLGRPGTWNLKNYELSPVFTPIKMVISKVVMAFKPKIVALIKNGFEKEQFIVKGDNSLDGCLQSFVEAIGHPSVNIFMKKNGLDRFIDKVLPEVQALYFRLHELADKAEKKSSTSSTNIDLESILKEFEDGIDLIISNHVQCPSND